jgi:sugar lactone lactonase YvrE
VPASITAVAPGWAVPGGRVAIQGARFPIPADGPPRLRIGGDDAHVVAASADCIRFIVPPTSEGGELAIRVQDATSPQAHVQVARTLTTGVHQVDSPAFDAAGRLYVTHSGARDTKVAVPLYRVDREGVREPIAVEIGNPTSLAAGPDGFMYVSSRFEGHVYRLLADDRTELYATELGVPTGVAFGPEGALYVGDRSGSILRVSADRQVDVFATLPASVAAFHLAFGPDDTLYVTAPTLATHDAVYKITPDRMVDVLCDGFGRPQGLAVDSTGALFVVDALAGASAVYRIDPAAPRPSPELVISGPTMIGIAFDPRGGVVLCSNDTIWHLDVDKQPWRR